MDTENFKKIADHIIAIKPSWFVTADELSVTHHNIEAVESLLSAKLPSEYLFFLLNYRAGYFGFSKIYSLNPASDWYLIDENSKLNSPPNFIPFSDDETGGYYGFIRNGDLFDNQVYFLDSSDNTITNTEKNFFEHVVCFAFELEHSNIQADI